MPVIKINQTAKYKDSIPFKQLNEVYINGRNMIK